MLGGLLAVLVLAAILFPVLAQSKVGPKLGIESIPSFGRSIAKPDAGRFRSPRSKRIGTLPIA